MPLTSKLAGILFAAIFASLVAWTAPSAASPTGAPQSAASVLVA